MPTLDARSSPGNRGPIAQNGSTSTRRRSPKPTNGATPGLSSLRLIEEQGEGREARQFIADCFERKFGARIPMFMPRLFTLRDTGGRVHGAMGLRDGRETLYLEQYLDSPIEQLIARHAGQHCDRGDVVEVGHLCGTFPGVVRTMIDRIIRRFDDEEFGWVTFTGTPGLRNAFHRLGLMPIEVGTACAEAVSPADRAAWGRYYDDHPRVFVGSVRLGSDLLHARALPDPVEAGE